MVGDVRPPSPDRGPWLPVAACRPWTVDRVCQPAKFRDPLAGASASKARTPGRPERQPAQPASQCQPEPASERQKPAASTSLPSRSTTRPRLWFPWPACPPRPGRPPLSCPPPSHPSPPVAMLMVGTCRPLTRQALLDRSRRHLGAGSGDCLSPCFLHGP